MKICISSGHGKYIRGASGNPVPPHLDEVDSARRVVEHVADYLGSLGVDVMVYHDDVSTTQSDNLDRIVDWHNSQGPHDYDVSVHFNAFEQTTKPMGTEVLYTTQDELAEELADAMALAGGFINRGPKQRTDLAFLNGTSEPAVLLEVCFCDSTEDSRLFHQNFDAICESIAMTLAGEEVEEGTELDEGIPAGDYLFQAKGKCSHFGGPEDQGVSEDENLAFIFDVDDAPHLFLPEQPKDTTGLARRLNPGVFYVACRWNYDITSKEMLANPMAQAVVRAHGSEFLAWPSDWGPHGDTDRIADLSPALMTALGVRTDDVVEVLYPARTMG